MRVAIVGSRDYVNLDSVDFAVSCLEKDDTVVSGGARGVDHRAALSACTYGTNLTEYYADWSKGRGAGYARNQKIIDGSDVVIAFYDGYSRGTAHSITLAEKASKPILVIPDVKQSTALLLTFKMFLARHRPVKETT